MNALDKYQRRYNRRQLQMRRCRNMDYASALSMLQEKAAAQARFQKVNRIRENLHHRYNVHLHGTHAWVPKKEWDRLSRGDRLNLSKYATTNPTYTDKVFTYAIPVPGKPIFLRVYRTDIATFHADGTVQLRADGHHGFFTQRWMNMVRHVNVHGMRMDKWQSTEWGMTDTHGVTTKFYDGLTLDKDGKIISEVRPFAKMGIDRSKSNVWHAATKHFNNLVLPFVAMLEAASVPEPVKDAIESHHARYSNEEFIEYILSMPQEFDPEIVTVMCMNRWEAYNPSMQVAHMKNMPSAQYNFKNRMKQLYKIWAKKNALKEM